MRGIGSLFALNPADIGGEAFDRIEAESMSRSAGLDWQMTQDDELEMEENTGYNVHTIEEVE